MSGTNGYEKKDVNVLKLLLAIFLTGGFVTVSPILLYQYYKRTQEALYFDRVLRPVAPDLLATRAQEEEQLHAYGVVDAQAQIYRIPIARAMELMVDEASASAKVSP